jgi:translation initiation factor IF-2
MPELEAFFHDLRALRAGACLSLPELAGRAHFSEEVLAAAEAGPAVPPNPVLVAYVQACGGPVGQWEDRWRNASATAEILPIVSEPASPPRPVAPRRYQKRYVAAAATAAVLVAAAAAVALTRPAARPTAGAGPRPAPSASLPAAPRPLSPHPASSAPRATPAPRMTSATQAANAGWPTSQANGVPRTPARPGPPRGAAQGGPAGNGGAGAPTPTVNPAGKQPGQPTLAWPGTLPAASAGLAPQVTALTAACPTAKGPGIPAAPPGQNSAIAGACSGPPG